MRAILIAGLICGTLDGLSAVALASGRFTRLFQFIASGVLGQGSFKGGAATVALGVALHFTIALGAATVYFFASRYIPFMIERALIAGVIYGALVHLVMGQIIVPLSAIGRHPFNPKSFFTQLAVHMIVVGPSIALSIRRWSESE
jgi:hypothetical protein